MKTGTRREKTRKKKKIRVGTRGNKSNILTVHDHDRYEKRPVYYICTICAQTFDCQQ